MRVSVLLPLPLGPRMATHAPRGTCQETWRRIVVSPRTRVMSFRSIANMGGVTLGRKLHGRKRYKGVSGRPQVRAGGFQPGGPGAGGAAARIAAGAADRLGGGTGAVAGGRVG